jgi:lysozyme
MATPINVVIDLSHHQATVDFGKINSAGIVGVIHKATEGLTFVDPMYATRQPLATQAGLLWGAYHFGTGDDGSAQADFFLNTANPGAQTLIVLDYEANPEGDTMTLDQARDFINRVNQVTGRYPGLYSGQLIKQQLAGVAPPDPVFANCFLWVAQYGEEGPTQIPPTFPTWTLWQYTDGVNGEGPYEVDGVGKCDRNQFNGGLDQLNKLWGVPA